MTETGYLSLLSELSFHNKYAFIITLTFLQFLTGPSWSWSYGSWIYNYLCNQCISPLKMWVKIPLRKSVLDTTLCDKICQWFATGRWFSPGPPVSSTNKTDRHDITEMLLKVELNTIKQIKQTYSTLQAIHVKFCIFGFRHII
jgi:hypothetical protein